MYNRYRVTFTFDEILKDSRPSYKQKPLIFRVFTSGYLCTATILVAFLEHGLLISDEPVLFIITVKSYEKASKTSISRLIKLTMSEVEINSGLLISYSCRSISTSKVFETSINSLTILKSADSKFKKNYHRDMQQEYQPIKENFGLKLLEQRDSNNKIIV